MDYTRLAKDSKYSCDDMKDERYNLYRRPEGGRIENRNRKSKIEYHPNICYNTSIDLFFNRVLWGFSAPNPHC